MTAFPIDDVRGAFPALALTDHGRARAYLDNPAGTQVPQPVIEAVARCLTETNANLGGAFVTSKAADAVVGGAHAAMADLLGAASAREVVIGPSMTSLTYRISRSLGRRLEPGDEVVVTRMDHDGNVAPWLQLAEDRGLVVRWLPFDRESWRIEPEALDHVLSEKTRILALNYASNLTGSVNDVAALAARAKAAGALVYVDAVQLAPHRLVDVAALGCDFLVCSSYKFFGPHLGVLWGRGDLLAEMFPYQCRCASDEIPKKFETGTPQIELLAGLEAAVDYFAWLGERTGAEEQHREDHHAPRAGEDAPHQRAVVVPEALHEGARFARRRALLVAQPARGQYRDGEPRHEERDDQAGRHRERQRLEERPGDA